MKAVRIAAKTVLIAALLALSVLMLDKAIVLKRISNSSQEITYEALHNLPSLLKEHIGYVTFTFPLSEISAIESENFSEKYFYLGQRKHYLLKSQGFVIFSSSPSHPLAKAFYDGKQENIQLSGHIESVPAYEESETIASIRQTKQLKQDETLYRIDLARTYDTDQYLANVYQYLAIALAALVAVYLIVTILLILLKKKVKKEDLYTKETLFGNRALYNFANNIAKSTNGIGIDFMGFSDHRDDGTVIVTKWITMLKYPIIPLCRMRIQPVKEKFGFFNSSFSYNIVELLPLSRRENKKTQLRIPFTFGPVVLLASAIWILQSIGFNKYEHAVQLMTGLLIGWVGISIILILMYNTKEQYNKKSIFSKDPAPLNVTEEQ